MPALQSMDLITISPAYQLIAHILTNRYAVALTYDAPSATVKLYVDGEVTASCTGPNINPSTVSMATDVLIGRSVTERNSSLNGELGCFRIYNRTLRSDSFVCC